MLSISEGEVARSLIGAGKYLVMFESFELVESYKTVF